MEPIWLYVKVSVSHHESEEGEGERLVGAEKPFCESISSTPLDSLHPRHVGQITPKLKSRWQAPPPTPQDVRPFCCSWR